MSIAGCGPKTKTETKPPKQNLFFPPCVLELVERTFIENTKILQADNVGHF